MNITLPPGKINPPGNSDRFSRKNFRGKGFGGVKKFCKSTRNRYKWFIRA
jgi:hypothetical protein